MTHRRWIAVATLCAGMGLAVPAAGAQQTAPPTDQNGEVQNPQPHTKKEYDKEKKREKKELKHNQESDKAAAKAEKHSDKAANEQDKAAREADKANDEAAKPQ